jgi:hypothetical protein
MRKILTFGTMVVLALALVAMTLPANANLVPTSFGFPVIVQNGTTTAFNQDTATAADLENVAISFPTAEEGTLDFGAVNLAFPSITQNTLQTQDVTHTDFAQTNEFAEFAYPFTSVGATSLPGFGFGF